MMCRALVMGICCLGVMFAAAAEKEYRTVNSGTCEVVLLKRGGVNLLLTSGQPVFEGAEAWSAEEGERERPLPLSSGASLRTQYKSRLGRGHGFVLRGKQCEWRIDTYPTKPFLTVQLVYLNERKKPVTLHSLDLWRGTLSLGPGAEGVRLLVSGDGLPAVSTGGSAASARLALVNAASGRCLVAGFLEPAAAETVITVERDPEAEGNVYGTFSASVRFDPPLVLEPDEQVETPRLYLGVAEQDPLLGLDRYGKALAVVNGVRDARPFVPHGLVLAPGQDASAAGAWLREHLASFGYDTLWTADPADLAATRGLGLRAGLVGDAPPLPLPAGWPPDALHLVGAAPMERPVAATTYLAADGLPRRTGLVCEGVRLAAAAGDWRAEAASWARTWYLVPHLLLPLLEPIPASDPHLRTRLTAAAMLGAPVRVGGDTAALEAALPLLRRAVPTAGRPARPLDVFEEYAPRTWHLALDGVDLVGFFNLDGTGPGVNTVPLAALGLPPGRPFTVFDAWDQQYLGTAMDLLRVAVDPGEVRLLALRELGAHPVFLGGDHHFAQGGLDAAPPAWDAAGGRIHGAFNAVAGMTYTLSILAPETWTPGEAVVSSGEASVTREGRVLHLRVTPAAGGLLTWSLGPAA